MNPKQNAAFLAYWGLGGERSLDKLYQEWGKLLPELRCPRSITTLKIWSSKFGWQKKVKEMDEEANEKLFKEAISAAQKGRMDILKVFRTVVLKFAIQLKNNPDKEITSSDVVNFWRMARTEMGLDLMPDVQINIDNRKQNLLIEILENATNEQRQKFLEFTRSIFKNAEGGTSGGDVFSGTARNDRKGDLPESAESAKEQLAFGKTA